MPNDIEDGANSNRWISVAVPLSEMKFAGDAGSATLKSVAIAGDDYADFYVGQIRLVTDDTPITCFAGDQQDVAAGDEVDLHGTATGGVSSLNYGWDFDAKGAFTEQATGKDVTTQYQAGDRDYTVMLTVTDADGVKKPATCKTVIHVEQ